jgi:hypothetical protein
MVFMDQVMQLKFMIFANLMFIVSQIHHDHKKKIYVLSVKISDELWITQFDLRKCGPDFKQSASIYGG